MHIEKYERLKMDVTLFDTEDIITTSVMPYNSDENESGPETGFPTIGGGGTGGSVPNG